MSDNTLCFGFIALFAVIPFYAGSWDARTYDKCIITAVRHDGDPVVCELILDELRDRQ